MLALRSIPQAPVSLERVAELLRGLDRDQRRAVTHGEGPLLVIAGPGTGKTEVITRRVAWLIATKRALPSEILALTFTDRAADEMQARVDVLVPYGHAEAAIHTFHAFGDRLVREFAYELGLPSDPRVISRAEAVVLLRENLFALGLERYRPLADPTRFLGALVDRFARAKEEGHAPADLVGHADGAAREAAAALAAAGDTPSRGAANALAERAAAERELAVAFDAYQTLLRERGLVDFGDQVAIALRLMRERPAVRAEVQRRYRYVVVDESQDTDPVQVELLLLLAGQRRSITVVGDEDQSIYAFRGTAPTDMAGSAARFPGATRVVLRRNHRSLTPILTAAHRLIAHNDGVPGATEDRRSPLRAVRRSRRPAPVRCTAFATVEDEADAVASAIADRVAAGAAARDLAILVRTNADAGPFLKSLALRGLPVRFSGATGLYARPEVRELLSFLRAVADPDSTVDLYGVVTGAPYHLGGENMTAILEMARRRHRSLWSIVTELEDQPRLLRLTAATRRGLDRLRADLRVAIEESHRRPAGEVLYEHLKRSGSLRELVADADRGRDAPLRNVARLFDVVRAQSAIVADDRVAFVVRHLQALTAAGDDPTEPDAELDEDAVAVLTVHKAKGLEFPVVFLVGLVDGRFPLRGRGDRIPMRSEHAPGEASAAEPLHAEERRLFYVAMTRARDELHLSWSRLSASGRRRRPSPFIAEALDRTAEEGPQASRDSGSAGEALAAHLAAGLDRGSIAGPSTGGNTVRSPRQGPLSLSFSQIDDYLSCPLKFRLRHVVRVPTPPHHALVLGNALHQAAAAFHNASIRGRPFSEVDLLAVFDAHWSSDGFLSRDHEEARYAQGRAALIRFREQQLASGAPPPVAVERPFAVSIDGDVVRGRYDRVDETGEGVVITDYKSSDVRDDARAAQKARDSLQLQVYALAHEAETGHLPAAVQLHFLDSGVVGRAAPDRARLEKARTRIREAATGIRAAAFDARPDHVGCGFCPYRDVCPSSAA